MNENGHKEDWVDDRAEDEDGLQVEEYDITVSPNDFNVMTLHNFVESGSVSIPGFQRNFVWDLKRSSKLIESLIRGLPIPQLFLYEQERNKFLVIDGQQRLMSIYYFIKKRFPKTENRAKLRTIFEKKGLIPEDVLYDNKYFQNFNLRLSESLPNHANKFNGLNYATLGDYKTQFDLRPIRNILVKQNSPSNDDSSIYEIFNRLNSGGVTLRPQEIRTSMYHSDFYNLLSDINGKEKWRNILGNLEPDVHMKDIEILLRGFALLVAGNNYAPSMVKFLNQFSNACKAQNREDNEYLGKLFESFLETCSNLPENAFKNKNNRFNVALYEAVFTAACEGAFAKRCFVTGALDIERIEELKEDKEFTAASQEGTTQTKNVTKRLSRAREIVGALNVGTNPNE